MKFIYGGVSVKNQRKSNMDSLLLKERAIDGHEACIAAVCDGVGSLLNGAFASSAATRMLSEWFDEVESCRRLGLQMRDAVLEINRRVFTAARDRGLRTGSTLSALLLAEGRYYIVHTGDSRVYAWNFGPPEQLTEDQSLNGRLTACLGREATADIYYNEGVCRGERFLVCSDGLYKRVEPAVLQTAMERADRKSLYGIIQQLVRRAVEQGEHDNISLAIVLNEL